MDILTNPNHDALVRLLAEAPRGLVRALRAPDGTVYAWAAHDARHVEVVAALDLPFADRASLQAASYRFSRQEVDAVRAFTDLDDLVRRLAELGEM
ncbi:hypothetical protein FV242_30795 [Methylobacterium sp. WL64]|uniref:hypothetical protein n=1 Tax=Methylobacterium sp. WL64 TaxID=2603894 RepID=UPI0011D64643|nr:hypothetical protein [Methylobacterium sp. WL64]TXM97744.1 hypothetical protein FV242_30795 [Methylobacterium sp. WL64]